MACGCASIPGIVIKHSELESSVYIHTKAETPDPAVTTSASAYAKFQIELRMYLRNILLDATNLDLRSFPNGAAAYAEMERRIVYHQRQLPLFVERFLQRQARAGMRVGMSKLPTGRQVEIFPEAIERQIESAVVRLQKQSRLTLNASLRNLFGDGLERGETIKELTERVQGWARRNGDIDRQAKWRAQTVARTESSRALHEGQIEAWKEAGVTRMSWLKAPNPCEFCDMMSRKSHSIDQPFFGQGDTLKAKTGRVLKFDYTAIRSPPLHPNCRCDLVPIISNK